MFHEKLILKSSKKVLFFFNSFAFMLIYFILTLILIDLYS